MGLSTVLAALFFGLFTFWCPVKKNEFYYSLVLNITAKNGQFGPCFQNIFLFLVAMVKLSSLQNVVDVALIKVLSNSNADNGGHVS